MNALVKMVPKIMAMTVRITDLKIALHAMIIFTEKSELIILLGGIKLHHIITLTRCCACIISVLVKTVNQSSNQDVISMAIINVLHVEMATFCLITSVSTNNANALMV